MVTHDASQKGIRGKRPQYKMVNHPTEKRTRGKGTQDKMVNHGSEKGIPGNTSKEMCSDDFGSKRLSEDASDRHNDEIVIHIEEMLQNQEPRLSNSPTIYRVPEKIRNLNEQAYSPRVISIGPFHHKSERLKSMDTIKTRYFQKLIRESKVSLREYVQLVKGLEERARRCYAETIGMSRKHFVTMMLIDACFIIELLLRFYESTDQDEDDGYLLSTPWLRFDVCLDLMLLENQIPFFLLDEIYVKASRSRSNVISLKELAIHFFKTYTISSIDEKYCEMPNHFTDLILNMFRPTWQKPQGPLQKGDEFPSTHNVTVLREAGVKFKASTEKHFLDVVFERGVLTIPCFSLNDHTEIFVRNLMALELCHQPNNTNYITDYILFMDYLINTSNDIDILTKRGIIVNGLGESNAAAYLFNNLCKNVTVARNTYLWKILEDLNAYYRKPMHKWKETFKRDYLSTPWKTASTIAAIVLLALTLTQTICSILALTSFK